MTTGAIRLDPDGVYSIRREVVRATFDGQLWLYHLGDGQAHTLSPTAGIVLELIDGRRPASEIRELLQETYSESAADVGRDIDRTLRYLLEHGALDVSTAASERPGSVAPLGRGNADRRRGGVGGPAGNPQ